MPAVYPVMASWGYSAGGRIGEVIEAYDDGTTRRFRWSSFVTGIITLRHERLSQAEKNTLEAFWRARKSGALNDHIFYLYSPEEVSSIDLTGGSPTGRHSAYFIDPEYQFTRDGRCRWSIDWTVHLID